MIFIFTRISFFLLFLSQAIASPPFNLSHFIYPKFSEEFHPQPSLFLKDVLGAISDGEKWESEDVRVSKLEVGKVKYGNLQRYEIRFPLENTSDLVVKLWDDVSLWKRFREREGGEFEVLANEVSSRPMLDPIRMEGPFELLVAGDDEMSLMLPWNTSYAGLKRILVGDDITVEVKNVHEVSLFHTSDIGVQTDGNPMTHREQWLFPHLTCMPLLPIRVSGSASVVAFRTRNHGANITTAHLSQDATELLSEKSYSSRTHEKQQCPIESLRTRIRLLEKILKSFWGGKHRLNAARKKLKVKMEASTLFRFQLELERVIRTNDTRWNTMAEWRTRPTVEHVLFEVMARIERKRLKPLVLRKVIPFVGVDSSAWSNLMANISFTKLSSVLVSPEALTLDVKW